TGRCRDLPSRDAAWRCANSSGSPPQHALAALLRRQRSVFAAPGNRASRRQRRSQTPRFAVPGHATQLEKRGSVPPPEIPQGPSARVDSVSRANPKIDLISVASFAHGQPHDQFRWLRANDPVYWHEELGGRGFWAVTRHQDVCTVSRDPQTY